MDEIICYTNLLPIGEKKELTFWDILFDDRWTQGGFSCSEELYSEIGNLNQKLSAGRNYEFLLRAAEKYSVTAVGCEPLPAPAYTVWDSFRTDCYIVGKYREKLQEHDSFKPLAAALLEQAAALPVPQEGIAFLESMISHGAAYYEIDDNTRPILLYRDTDVCYNMLNLFIESLGMAFQRLRQRVEFFDAVSEGRQALTQYINQRFKAIIGIQTYFFAIAMQDKATRLHNLIHGPKYNMILDHPAWLKEELKQGPDSYYLLLHDRNYIRFAARYYPKLSGCIPFPPAGILPSQPYIPMELRSYDLSFVGTYRNYRSSLKAIYTYDRTHRHIAAHYLRLMRSKPDYSGEKALEQTLRHFGVPYDDEKFLELFYDMRQAYFCILLYYREKIIRTLLQEGLTIHVFGESWKHAPFAKHPGLICHEEVDAKEGLRIMQDSRLSLNIMSWHKDGLTERIFNGMLCQSVVVSDQTPSLQEEFQEGEDVILFSLDNISALPSRLKALLSDNNRMQQIALNGYRKALSKHTWLQRAEQLLDIWDAPL